MFGQGQRLSHRLTGLRNHSSTACPILSQRNLKGSFMPCLSQSHVEGKWTWRFKMTAARMVSSRKTLVRSVFDSSQPDVLIQHHFLSQIHESILWSGVRTRAVAWLSIIGLMSAVSSTGEVFIWHENTESRKYDSANLRFLFTSLTHLSNLKKKGWKQVTEGNCFKNVGLFVVLQGDRFFWSLFDSVSEDVTLHTTPPLVARCGENVTLTCDASMPQRLEIIKFYWVGRNKTLCQVEKEKHDPEVACEYAAEATDHRLTLTLINVTVVQKEKFICKLYSRKGDMSNSTYVTVRGEWTRL